MLVKLLVSVSLLATTAWCRQFNCTVGESVCTGNGMQSIVVGGVRMCCPPSASFNINNDVCHCVDTTVEEPCRQGAAQCVGAMSTVRDSQGEVRCCLPGHALNHISNSVVNGQLVDVCTCTRVGGVGGGMLSQVLGLNNGLGSMMMANQGGNGNFMMSQMGGMSPAGGSGQALNATEMRDQWRQFGEGWRQFGRQFVDGARGWANNMGRNLHGISLDLGRSMSGVLQNTFQRSMVPLQRAVGGLFQSLFSSIPGARP